MTDSNLFDINRHLVHTSTVEKDVSKTSEKDATLATSMPVDVVKTDIITTTSSTLLPSIHEQKLKTTPDVMKRAPPMADSRFLCKASLTIRCTLHPRSSWVMSQWSHPQTFYCDYCRRQHRGYRISRPTKPPILESEKGRWTVEGSYCSMSCEREATLKLPLLLLDDILPIETRMYREVYDIHRPIPPMPDPSLLETFSTGRFHISEDAFKRKLVFPTHGPDTNKHEFTHVQMHETVELLTYPGEAKADPQKESKMLFMAATSITPAVSLPSAPSDPGSKVNNEFDGLDEFYELDPHDPFETEDTSGTR